MTTKLNCWEYTKCARQAGATDTAGCGPCPASQEARLAGVHGGVNGGRACWVVAGTFCREPAQGAHAQQVHTCVECEFFRLVQREEGDDFHMSVRLAEKLYGPTSKPARPPRKRKGGVPGAPW